MTLEEAAKILQKGEVLAFSTETFFGLGVDPKNIEAVEKLLTLKGREEGRGIPLIFDEMKRLYEWGVELPEAVEKKREELVTQFWPGPLTVVFTPQTTLQAELHRAIFGPERSLAVRVSSAPLARTLAYALGGAITATSANPPTFLPASNEDQVKKYFPSLPIISEDLPREALPSTIVDTRGFPFKILREGAIDASQLRAWC